MVGKQSGGAAEEVGTGEEGGNAHVRAGEVVPTRYRWTGPSLSSSLRRQRGR